MKSRGEIGGIVKRLRIRAIPRKRESITYRNYRIPAAVYPGFNTGRNDGKGHSPVKKKDDAKLIRRFKAANIPFILPAIFIYILVQKNKLTIHDAVRSLEKLSEFISEDESSSVRILLEKTK